MANTVSLLNYTNTFGDWVVATNNLAKENNDFAANNYIKPTGTLYLNAPTLGLQVANNAIVAGQLQVQGIGSSAYIQNNLRVDTQVYFQNTILGLTNSGELISNGKITASGSGTGLSVANNTTIGGTLDVTGATALGNTLTVLRSTTLSNTLTVARDATFASNVIAQNYVNVTADVNAVNFNALGSLNSYGVNVIGNGAFSGQVSVGGNFVINGTTVYSTNTFTLNAGSVIGLNSSFNVNRGTSGANASIRWNESNTYFDILNLGDSTYYRILTRNLLSDSITNTSASTPASANAVSILKVYVDTANTSLKSYVDVANTSLKSYTDNTIVAANTSLKSYTDNTIVAANTSLKSYTDNTIVAANTAMKAYVDANVVVLAGRVDAANTNASNAGYVTVGTLPSGRLTGSYTGITGVGTITTGTWSGLFGAVSGANLTGLTAGNLTGTIPTGVLGNSTLYVGTTAIALNRASAGQTLTGTNIDGTAGAVAWTNVTGRPTAVSSFTNDSGYLVSSGTIQNANYAGSYAINYSNRSNANYQVLWGSGNLAYGSDLLFMNPSSGALYSYNNITAYYSDDRLKTKLGNIESALDKVSQLNGFLYVQNDLAASFGYNELKSQVGVSAQEVQKVQPEAVKLAAFDVGDDGTSKSGENYLTVQYDKLVPLLIEAIKELKAEVEILKNK